jgi:hypothetical protein
VGPRGSAGQGGEGRGAPEWWVNGEAVQTESGGGVAPVVVDEGGWVLQLEGDPGVRRRQSIEGKSSSEGRSPEGADGGDARTESSAEEGFRRRKTGEVDVWAMGMKA